MGLGVSRVDPDRITELDGRRVESVILNIVLTAGEIFMLAHVWIARASGKKRSDGRQNKRKQQGPVNLHYEEPPHQQLKNNYRVRNRAQRLVWHIGDVPKDSNSKSGLLSSQFDLESTSGRETEIARSRACGRSSAW